jgi:hypothetical protein
MQNGRRGVNSLAMRAVRGPVRLERGERRAKRRPRVD